MIGAKSVGNKLPKLSVNWPVVREPMSPTNKMKLKPMRSDEHLVIDLQTIMESKREKLILEPLGRKTRTAR